MAYDAVEFGVWHLYLSLTVIRCSSIRVFRTTTPLLVLLLMLLLYSQYSYIGYHHLWICSNTVNNDYSLLCILGYANYLWKLVVTSNPALVTGVIFNALKRRTCMFTGISNVWCFRFSLRVDIMQLINSHIIIIIIIIISAKIMF